MDTLAVLQGISPSMPAAVAAPEEPFRLNMHYGVTSTSHQIYDLHMLVLWICTAIGAAVFTLMIWSLIRDRRARGAVPAKFSGNAKVEIIWIALPALILVGIAVPATRTLVAINRHPNPDVIVDVTGAQWDWHYSYAGQGIAFYSKLKEDSRNASREGSGASPASVPYYLRDVDHPLVLPVNKRILLRITAEDVMHSWWVPALGFKRDAIPGFVNEAEIVIDKPGTYRGQCAELCGEGHGFMPIVVKAVAPEAFLSWVREVQRAEAAEHEGEKKAWTRTLAMTEGKRAYDSMCASCHQPDGKGLPGVFPALDGSKIVNGPLEAHLKIVIHGSRRNPVMRAFGKEMGDRALAAVLTYERNAWGNHTGDLVTPDAVEAAR